MSQSLPLFLLRTSEIILPLLCMANSSSDLQACHLKQVWDHPKEISKQWYLSLSLMPPHPILLCSHQVWVLGYWSTRVPSSVCLSLYLPQSWQGDFSPPHFPFSSLINFGPDGQSPISQHAFDWQEPLINLIRMKSSSGHLLCLAFSIPHIPPLSAE